MLRIGSHGAMGEVFNYDIEGKEGRTISPYDWQQLICNPQDVTVYRKDERK